MQRLPAARLISNEPSAALVRWMLRLTFLMLAIASLLVLVGNHIPKA